ncbi:MAG: hypothetical protein MJ248_04265 [Bacilli bacterium]|nr:hypothetical protein [Bacilli bacterium]
MNKIKQVVTPKTRKEQCKLLLGTRFRTIISIGLLNILFFLPFIAINIVKVNYLSSLVSSMQAVEAATNEILFMYRNWYLLFDAVQIVSIMIISIGLAGSMKIIKTLCYDEPVLFWENFKTGVKENWKNYLLVSLFFSITLIIVNFTNNSSRLMETKMMSMISWGVLGIFIFILSPVLLVALSMDATYKNKLGNSLTASASMLMRHYFGYIFMPGVMLVVYIGLYFMNFALSPYIIGAISLLFILYLLPIFMLLGYEYCLFLFDKYINSNYPELYKRGLDNKEESNS